MRRIFFNLFVSILTFVIGITASVLLSPFSSSEISANREAVTTITELKPPPPAQKFVNAPISGGVLNGKAISLPQPAYPPVAKAARQSGTVTVQVVIDENGKVISARAISGPPLLQAAAVQAASAAIFSPTKLSGKPVKVTGVVTYNFVLQ